MCGPWELKTRGRIETMDDCYEKIKIAYTPWNNMYTNTGRINIFQKWQILGLKKHG